jgi:DNA-binding Lrp family transcriptional regulator
MHRISSESTGKRLKIGVKDQKILVLLSENSRMPISEIAKKTRVSRETVNYRIKRMQNRGAILKFIAEIDFKRLGFNLYSVFILVDEKDKEKQKALITALKEHSHTINVIEYSDRWDLEWRLIAKSIEEFDEVVSDLAAKFSDIIIEKNKLGVINTYYSILLPYVFHKEHRKKQRFEKKKKKEHKIDKQDLKILQILANNSRASTYEISKKVKLSADTIGLRIKKLVNSGIIKKFTLLINLSLLGYSWYTFTMQMRFFSKKEDSKFVELVRDHPYIIKAVKTLGTSDLLLYIIADNPRNFHTTIKQLKNEFADTIMSYDTFVAYEEHAYHPFPRIIGNYDSFK